MSYYYSSKNSKKKNNKRYSYRRTFRRRQKPISRAALRNAIRFVGAMQQKKEMKFVQNQIGFENNIDTDGVLASANGMILPTQGSNQHQRIGDRVVVKSITFNLQYVYGFVAQDINPGGTAVDQTYPVGALLRIILFVDRTNTIATMDEMIWPAGTPAEQVISNGYDPDYQKNVVILYDKVHTMNPSASVNNVPFEFIKIHHKFGGGGLELAFDEGTTTVTANAIRYILVTNIDTAASDDAKPDCLLNCRGDFYDP
jgi:hypothetical protein